jgi:tetratricopeptide (TPR) repeat protein
MSGLADFIEDRSPQSNYMRFDGDRNQGIGINNGNAFGNIEGNVYLNHQPKFLSLHQLPSDIADFTGRTTEIDTIRQQLLSGKSLVISAVAGMPGVGKSALAIHVAQQLAKSDFPDVQLYVDLRGADGYGLEPGAVLAGFLRAFGFNESNIPHDLQERASVYRSQLVGKRSIVLLDNAQDEAQVRPLLPGNAVVIITSRHVLGALSGATVLQLKVLSKDDAYDLLAKLVGIERLQAEPEAATEILRLCDGLPLAILIAGGTLKSKLHWQLADYSRKLADERQRLEHLQLSDLSVRASFELSYQELSPADGMLFSRLGILVGKDFGEELAAVLHDSDLPVIDGIERLIDAQLLEVTIDRRYHFHDLLRLFAREKLTESTSLEHQEEIKQQIVDWGHGKSKFMDTFLDPVKRRQIVQHWVEIGAVSVDDDEQAVVLSTLAWFEEERENLLCAIDWAEDAERWDTVLSFIPRLLTFLEIRSYWIDYEQICFLSIQAARQIGDRQGESRSLNKLGNAYLYCGKFNEAIECYQNSSTIDQELSDRYGEAQNLDGIGNVLICFRQWDRALGCFLKNLTICEELGDRQTLAKTYSGLGAVCKYQNQWDNSIRCYQQSLVIFQELGDWHGVAKNLNDLGNVYESQYQLDLAIDCYQESLSIKQILGDRYGESGSLNNLGIAYAAQFQWNQAIECYQESLSIFRELGNRSNGQHVITLINLGILYKKIGQLDQAISAWQGALINLPEGAPDYLMIQEWLEDIQNA